MNTVVLLEALRMSRALVVATSPAIYQNFLSRYRLRREDYLLVTDENKIKGIAKGFTVILVGDRPPNFEQIRKVLEVRLATYLEEDEWVAMHHSGMPFDNLKGCR